MAIVVGVKFTNSIKSYYFDPIGVDFEVGDGVIVETAKGVEYGLISIKNKEVEDEQIVQPLKPILRKATPKDKAKIEEQNKKIPWIVENTIKEVNKQNLDMKIIGAEIPFDNSKVIIFFSSPSRVDFRDFVKVLASIIHQRIELRQIGSRDETKILGGIAPCGRVCCCHEFLPDFKKVSIKMAKNQGLSLNPTKISGLCGRLMCCLEYENDVYVEDGKLMPKLGSEVETSDGKGIVVSNNILKKTSRVKFSGKDGMLSFKDFSINEMKFTKKVEVEVQEEDDEKED